MSSNEGLSSEQRTLIGAAINEQAKLDAAVSEVGKVSTARARLLISLHKSGRSTRQIAEHIGISHTAVARAIQDDRRSE